MPLSRASTAFESWPAASRWSRMRSISQSHFSQVSITTDTPRRHWGAQRLRVAERTPAVRTHGHDPRRFPSWRSSLALRAAREGAHVVLFTASAILHAFRRHGKVAVSIRRDPKPRLGHGVGDGGPLRVVRFHVHSYTFALDTAGTSHQM